MCSLLLRLGRGRLGLRLLGLSKEIVVPEGRLGDTSTGEGNSKNDLLVPGKVDLDERSGLDNFGGWATLRGGRELAASSRLEWGTESADGRLGQGSDHVLFYFVEWGGVCL